MTSALESSAGIVGYLALFTTVGLIFVFVNLLLGRFLRPNDPHREKLEIYECGEPAIGSSFVQFDLRFYVVALVFIIFDVEVAFLFPWATVFGKLANLRNDNVAIVEGGELTPTAAGVYKEMGMDPTVEVTQTNSALQEGVVTDGVLEFAGLEQLVSFSMIAAAIFFVVLLVGFAYEWRTGALDWVRAVSNADESSPVELTAPKKTTPQESVLSASS